MKFSKISGGYFGKQSIKALLDDGTILGVIKTPGVDKGITYFINHKPVKNKGATNKIFSKNIENFALMLKKLV